MYLFLIIIFLFFATIHVYWGVGGMKYLNFVIPTSKKGEDTIAPGSIACFAVAFVFFCLSVLFFLEFIDSEFIKYSFFYYLKFFVGVVFLLRAIGEFKYVGFFKSVKGTEFSKADTSLFSPLCLIISFTIIYKVLL